MFRETNVLTLDQIQRVLTYLKTITSSTNLVLELIIRTGMRSCEAVKIEYKDFDFKQNQITFKPAKNSNWRTVKLNKDFCERVARFCANNMTRCSIFQYSYHSRSVDSLTRMLRRAWDIKKTYCLGLDCPVSLHGLRHSYAILMLEEIEANGGNIEDLQQELGHKSLSSTAVYLQHKKREKLKKAQDKFVKTLG